MKKKILLALLSVLAIAIIAFSIRPAQDDGILATKAALAATGENKKLHRVTKTSFRMSPAAAHLCNVGPTQRRPHVGYHCHVFTSENALRTIQTGEGTYPVGSVIIKQKFYTQFAKQTALFTLMRKMDPGYDVEHGDWEYSIVDSAGTDVLLAGREESCIKCHKHYADTDFVSRVYLTPDHNDAR